MGCHLELAALLEPENGTHFRPDRLQEPVKHHPRQLLLRRGRAHIQRHTVQQRELAIQASLRRRGLVGIGRYVIGLWSEIARLAQSLLDRQASLRRRRRGQARQLIKLGHVYESASSYLELVARS